MRRQAKWGDSLKCMKQQLCLKGQVNTKCQLALLPEVKIKCLKTEDQDTKILTTNI